MNAPARSVRLFVLLGAESAAVFALSGLGRRAPFAIPREGLLRWLQTAPPADALVAVLRLGALAGSLWLLATTVAYTAARLTRIPAAVRATSWAASPLVRRAVDTALAASIAVGAGLTPVAAPAAHAASAPAPPTSVRDGHAGALRSLPAEPAPSTSTTRPPSAAVTAPPPPPVPPKTPVPPTPSDAVVVEAGDNLWEIAARQLAAVTRRARADVADVEVAPYWTAVCEQNRVALRSRDPNLIEPGELITFPPVG